MVTESMDLLGYFGRARNENPRLMPVIRVEFRVIVQGSSEVVEAGELFQKFLELEPRLVAHWGRGGYERGSCWVPTLVNLCYWSGST